MKPGPSAAKIVLLVLAVGAAGFAGCLAFVVWRGVGEKPADVAHPTTLTRAAFTLRYPGNWKVDTSYAAADPDRAVQIDSPGSCAVWIQVADDGGDPARAMKDSLTRADRGLAGARRTSFARWGAYGRAGTDRRGDFLAIRPTARMFTHSSATRSFAVMESCYDDDLPQAGAGFALIESSFQLRVP